MEALPYSGKSPKGWRAPEGTTLFVGNLAFSVDNMRCSLFIHLNTLQKYRTGLGYDNFDIILEPFDNRTRVHIRNVILTVSVICS